MNPVDYIKQFPLRKFQRGSVLLSAGDPLASVFAIREGYLKVTSISDAGIERLLWIAGRYDFAPVEQLFSKSGTARFFYTAVSDGSYYDIPKADLLAYAHDNPDFMAEIARGMSEHYDDFLQRVDAIDGLSVGERLRSTLLYLSSRFSANSSVNLYEEGLRITHQDLAAMIGSTRETTSIELANLRREGLIDYDRKSFIVHSRLIKEKNG
jgi:CRP/FNR family transcriptional regulator